MGFNTAVMILNDHLNSIEKDAEFGERLGGAISETFGRRGNGHYGGFSVLPSQHADWDQMVVIGQNRIRRFEDIEPAERDALLRRLARDAGYRLSKAPSPR
jgi:hypothetical protein